MEEKPSAPSEVKPDEKPPEKPKAKFYMNKDAINSLPLGWFEGRIYVIYTKEKAEAAAENLLRHDMLGFDTETKPVFRKGQKQNPIALIQLSTETTAYLFRVNEMGMTPGLKKVLESPNIIKIGQAMKHELLTMKKELGVNGRGFVDLLDVAHNVDTDPKSVKGLAALFLGIKISKRMQVTNWERERLSEKQLRYAATDAWACLEILKELRKRRLVHSVSTKKHR
ncbi:MAG: 3'-5' exonuclease domain-containing protein 2 [Candidatus Aenigmarchaeota archaeon]|nr:3'-5' exonuclease domain-containing protein 2 [Candidatus Aenigmarchaeota archaeon]